jgi:hypothetical protein
VPGGNLIFFAFAGCPPIGAARGIYLSARAKPIFPGGELFFDLLVEATHTCYLGDRSRRQE